MDLLVQSDEYVAMKKTYYTKMVYYASRFFSDSYTLQEDTICDRQISIAGKLFFKGQYLNIMQKRQIGIGSKYSSNKL